MNQETDGMYHRPTLMFYPQQQGGANAIKCSAAIMPGYQSQPLDYYRCIQRYTENGFVETTALIQRQIMTVRSNIMVINLLRWTAGRIGPAGGRGDPFAWWSIKGSITTRNLLLLNSAATILT
ncbi:uncharacterized protein CLUP02_06927 [Colletotrichum lupini]|uniref:Uncharacterized protein n=1 Tax=Colletotrichum lupini TaxID=145971 RepID=A0A9Q8WFK9_9PEZI|nr:uncharacterized protein CLUP02_06927 [Colletotrichum lupini]UQC81441.1 hypothetical protein CLUP02_06927 [Colletotrichum lupini]